MAVRAQLQCLVWWPPGISGEGPGFEKEAFWGEPGASATGVTRAYLRSLTLPARQLFPASQLSWNCNRAARLPQAFCLRLSGCGVFCPVPGRHEAATHTDT